MGLSTGARLGPYEVLAPLGTGGMGEVYRARDTKLNRDVALKILPDPPATDAPASPGIGTRDDRRARFQREAELLASLNHPSIAAIYGLEDSTATTALVLELVEGPTLADRIANGGLTIDEALPLAQQIADALEAAHDRGVVHRDLKPANIKVRADGTVKVLDFGLAKLLDPEGAALRSGSLSLSPTLSVHATVAGVILGTAAYMSPEQARGRPVDRRADIWAFGCVLFEMLSGTRPFDGEDVAEILGAVIHKEPAWNRLPATTPPHVRVAIERCLEKDVKSRIRDIGDVKLALGGAFQSAGAFTTTVASPAGGAGSGRRLSASIAMMLVASAITWTVTSRFQRPAPVPVSRFAIVPTGADTVTAIATDRNVAISPDGSHIVYVGNNGTALFARAIDRLETTALTPGAPRGPFVSPDGQWIGFFDGQLKKVAMSGGPPVEICGIDGQRRGGTWSEDGTIVFATGNPKTGLWRVPAAGGEPQLLTTPNLEAGEQDHVFPEFLPGGRAVLFTVIPTQGAIDLAQIAVLDLDSGTFKVVLKGGSQASYAATGHLIYGVADTLRAVPFDLATLTVTGAPLPVVPLAATTASGAAHFAISRTGTLVFMPEGDDESERTLVWVDRTGRNTPINAPIRVYRRLRLSPDGARLALEVADEGASSLWIWDLTRETMTRLTFSSGVATNPVWTPDSRHVLFSAAIGQPEGKVFRHSADGAGVPEPLTTSEPALPSSITPDGKWAVLVDTRTAGRANMKLLSLESDHRSHALTNSPLNERNAEISPDGRWIAYEAGTQGEPPQIFVRPFPAVDTGQWQISTDGGQMPVWSRDGRELFYATRVGGRDQSVSPATLMRVPVEAGKVWSAGRPERLFEAPLLGDPPTTGRTYDVSHDGRRFVLIRPPNDADARGNPRRFVVVQNWFSELAAAVK